MSLLNQLQDMSVSVMDKKENERGRHERQFEASTVQWNQQHIEWKQMQDKRIEINDSSRLLSLGFPSQSVSLPLQTRNVFLRRCYM